MNEVKVFCPATIANLSCGFDVLGLCLDNIGDNMIVRKTDKNQIRITKIEGADIPKDVDKNVAGVAAKAMLQHLKINQGFDIEIYKNIPTGSGIGSSAASSSGAVYAINQLLGTPLSREELISFAMKGEEVSCGTEHADNVAPAIMGGVTLIRSSNPLDVISLPVLPELYVSIIYPKIEIRTADSRAILPERISLKNAVNQWGNVGAFVSSLYTQDYELLSRSMTDWVAEPVRSLLIPFYSKVKEIMKNSGAIGSGISGSGPSMFAFTRGKEKAQSILKSASKIYESTDINCDFLLSKISTQGVKGYK